MILMAELRRFRRVLPVDLQGCIICWKKIALVEIENISTGGVRVKSVPSEVLGQVGQIYLTLDGFGEIFSDFRCLQKSHGVVRLMFQNLSSTEYQVLCDFIDFHDLYLSPLAG